MDLRSRRTRKNLRVLLFDFQGRLTRRQYGMVLLYACIIPLFVFLILGATLEGVSDGPDDAVVRAVALAAMLVEIVWGALATWVLFAAMAKRLQDFNRPGWASLLVFVPIIGAAIPFALLLFPGDASDNRFGPPPADIML